MDLSRLMSRLAAIGGMHGTVTEAEEKCSKCDCTPCECDDKEKVEEGKKPDFLDADKDGDKKEPMSKALDDKEEKVDESEMSAMRKLAGIHETKIEEDDVEEGNEFSGALKAAKDAGKDEFEVAGKKYKVNEAEEGCSVCHKPSKDCECDDTKEEIKECGDMEMSPMTAVGQMQSAPEQSNDRYTLTITRGDKNLNVTTDNPDELLTIMKLAGISGGTEVVQQPAPEQEVEESGYENTPDNTNARDPQAHGDIRDWGRKGTASASTHYTPAKSGDNPMNEQRMFDDYKNFKAGK